ncbi:hypothetical protein ACVW1C_003574 [Bradyrhizobium sp. USDA 4011]
MRTPLPLTPVPVYSDSMGNADNLFQPHADGLDDVTMIAAAIRCIDNFTDRFNARDLAGMDALLHSYSRDRTDGSIASRHRNLWIVTSENGRWGIKLRSY